MALNMAEIKEVRRKVLIIALGLLIVIMSFTGFVNYMTFADNYNNSLATTYSVAGNESVRKIEYALHYGKPIDNYYGMNSNLQELKKLMPELEQVNIILPDGEILYDLNGFVRDTRLPGELLPALVFEQGVVNENLSYQFHEGKAYIFISINDSSSTQVASLVMVFPRDVFLHVNSPFTRQLLSYLVAIAIIALVLLYVIFSRSRYFKNEQLLHKKRVLVALIVVIGSAQLVYSGVNYFLFKNAYMEMAYTSKDFLENIINKNIASVYDKGLTLHNIQGFDEYLDAIKHSLPQIQNISMIQAEDTYQASRIEAAVSDPYIARQMFKILLDMLTVLIISILFMIEITLLAVTIMTRGSTNAARHGINTETSHGLVRSLTFFVNFCAYMSLTFIPLIMKNMYEPIGGLSKDVVLGLPLSAEMLGGILAIILAGWSINKLGWRAILYIGALFLLAGNFTSGFSAGAVALVSSRAVAGLGLGFIMMAIRSMVVSLPETNAAIAEFSAGSIAGLNCGAVVGGMLAERIGCDTVFYLAAILIIIPFILVYRLMNQYEVEVRETSNISALAKFTNFIADKKAIIFLLCIFIPYFISGAFLDYYFPLFAAGNDLSQSDISRGVLLNGLLIIYLGPVLTRVVIKKLGNTRGMILSMIIVVCALASFVLSGSIAAAFVTLILLGIAESFGVSLKTTYFLNLKGIKDLEINKGMAYFSVMVNTSRMAGPMIFGVALSWGARMGVGLISLGILILLLVFISFTRLQRAGTGTSEAA